VNSPIVLALDTKDLEVAKNWIAVTNHSVATYKVGLEFFLKFGSQGVLDLRNCGDFELFLDLKLHDIPNTVAAAAGSVSHLLPKFLTVHASGGHVMVAAAATAVPQISITAVTILTSLSDADLFAIGFALAKMSVTAGARSIVCSPLEVSAIRQAVPSDIDLITPGVRPLGSDAADQLRTTTPAQAIELGANFVVIGRPITQKWQESATAMSEAAKSILESLN
jgi:orotidine-5'-phosphate decarboxylase